MEGAVSRSLEPTVRLKLIGANSYEVEIDALIDTGFNGYLTLTPSLIASLGWPFEQEERAELGDGSDKALPIYRGIVMWEDNPRLISAVVTESTPSIGTALL